MDVTSVQHFHFDFDQVKRAAVEQIRTARQTSEEACWQCGRPATETCSGIGIGVGTATELRPVQVH